MDKPAITLRAIRPDDAEAIADMSNQPGFRHNTGRLPFQTIASTRAWIEKLGPETTAIVAEAAGAVVGSASMFRYDGRRAHAALLNIGVADQWVGQGVGTAMMAALIDKADRWLGLRRLELTVYTDNAPGLALYRRFGFEVEGTLRGFALRDGVFTDAYTMARRVPAPT